MSIQHLKESVPSRTSSDYAILPLEIYSPSPVDTYYFIPYHWHDEIELLYIEHGEFILHISGETHVAKAGDVYFINSQEIHQITATTLTSTHHAIVFDPKIIRFQWHDVANLSYLTPLTKSQIKLPLTLKDDHLNAIIGAEIKQSALAFHQGHLSWSLVAKSSILKIMALLASAEAFIRSESLEKKDVEKSMIARTVMTYVQENYMNKIALDDLAGLVNLSTPYFCKFFKSLFAKTPVEYINEYRVEKASFLLTQTDDKIIDISFSVGFEHFSYFIRKFKKIKGLTPSEYRKHHGR